MTNLAQPSGAVGAGTLPPATTSVARHYMRYLNAQLVNTVASLISFPIMARLLSKEQFGIIAYFEMFPLLWVAILKLGTQHSILRFYPVYGNSADPAKRREYYASLVAVPGLLSVALGMLSMLAIYAVNRIRPIEYVEYLYFILILGQLGVLASLTDNVMRAREHSKKSSWFSILGRYVDFVCVLGLVALTHTAMGFYIGKLASGLLSGAVLLWWLVRNTELNLSAFRPDLFKQSLQFGLPMVISEISLILLAFADRIMINKYLPGDAVYVKEQLGVYGLGYMLAMYIGGFLRNSLAAAYQPVANRLYEQQGAAAVRTFKHKLLKMLIYAAIAISIGLLLGGRALVHLAAGLDKIEAAPVFIWVGINYVINPILTVAGYGLVLLKRTRVIAWVVLLSVIVNIVLNLIWIPRYGIMGAVYATLVAYIFMGVYQILKCPRELRSWPRAREIIIPSLAALVWAGAVLGLDQLGIQSALAQLITGLGKYLPHGRLEELAAQGSGSMARLLITGALFVPLYLIPSFRADHSLREEFTKRLFKRKARA